ncbi:hypothetical protein Tco_0715766 [Tanacetum coccineum]
MRRQLKPREDLEGIRGICNFTGRVKRMHIFVKNFTYVSNFMIVEDISSIKDPRLSQRDGFCGWGFGLSSGFALLKEENRSIEHVVGQEVCAEVLTVGVTHLLLLVVSFESGKLGAGVGWGGGVVRVVVERVYIGYNGVASLSGTGVSRCVWGEELQGGDWGMEFLWEWVYRRTEMREVRFNADWGRDLGIGESRRESVRSIGMHGSSEGGTCKEMDHWQSVRQFWCARVGWSLVTGVTGAWVHVSGDSLCGGAEVSRKDICDL